MDAFFGLEDDLAFRVALGFQGTLVIFFMVSPLVGKMMHSAVAKVSNLVLIICTTLLVGNLIYMGMVYIGYPSLPDGTISNYVWIILSFCTAFSIAVLVGRYLNWYLSDNIQPGIWSQEFDNLADEEMLPFDRLRKREMERRKRV